MKYDLPTFIKSSALHVSEHGYDRSVTPLLAIDECLNHPVIHSTLKELVKGGYIYASMPMWYQKHARQDGSVLVFSGKIPQHIVLPLDIGKPVKGGDASFDDENVACLLIGQLAGGPVIFLSENIKWNPLGIWDLLNNHIAPHMSESLSLTTLFKSHKISYQNYSDTVARFCKTGLPPER